MFFIVNVDVAVVTVVVVVVVEIAVAVAVINVVAYYIPTSKPMQCRRWPTVGT